MFHNLGPCILKERSAKVLHLAKGTTNKFVSDADLRPGLPGLQTVNRFWRYSGAFPMMDLWTRVSILWLILLQIGNHWRVDKHSVELSIFDFPKTTLAARFWTLCIWLMLTSRREITNPNIRVVHASEVRNGLMSLIHCMLIIDVLHFFTIWSLKVRLLSIHILKNLTTLLMLTFMLFTSMLVVVHLASCFLAPNIMNSVFPSFICNLFLSIQSLTSLRQFCKMVMVVCSAFLPSALKDLLREWSSANPFRHTSSGTSSCRVEA